MTQIQSMVQRRPRRPGELGVHSVDHFNFIVPDLKQAQKFYADFGLDVREEGNGLGLYTAGHDHRWGRVGEGSGKKLTYISFGLYPEDFEGLTARLKQNGVIAQLDSPDGFDSNGVWFRDPDGTLIEMRVAEKSSPNEKAVQSNPSSPPGVQGSHAQVQGAVRASAPPRPHPAVQHATSAAPSSSTIGVLGLRLSDRSGDGVAFMHGIHGSDHHMIALAKSDGPGLHHLSWDVGLHPRSRAGRHADGRPAASPQAGAWAATCSAPTTSTMSATRGAATANTRPTSTTSRSTVDWPSGDHPAMTRSTSGDPRRRPISSIITRPRRNGWTSVADVSCPPG